MDSFTTFLWFAIIMVVILVVGLVIYKKSA
jgi:hypothetical protein